MCSMCNYELGESSPEGQYGGMGGVSRSLEGLLLESLVFSKT